MQCTTASNYNEINSGKITKPVSDFQQSLGVNISRIDDPYIGTPNIILDFFSLLAC